MKTCVLMLGCLLATASLAQSTQTRREVWQWRDANGVTHFSDQPVPGARKVVLGVSQPAPPVAAPAPVSAAAAARTTPAPAPVTYSSLEIWQPENGASFFGSDAVVEVRLRSDPALAPGDRVLTYLDGKLLPGENALEHSLASLSRGVHSLTSVILDPQGNERIRSEPVVFHIKQPTVNSPSNVGPSLRPRPQPLPAPANAGPR
jgi:hypothetical protein